MTARSIRRALEHKARKEEARQAKANSQQTSSQAQISPKQLVANRIKPVRSTGPKTAAGKKTVSFNAVKTGLTGQTVLLPTDDAEEYAAHIQRFINLHNPVGAEEQILVQSLADTAWRMMRIPRLEFAIYAQGHQLFAPQLAHSDPHQQAAFIELQTWLHFEKQLSNLMRQDARLRRNREKDEASLRQMQSRRQHLEPLAKQDGVPSHPERRTRYRKPSSTALAKKKKEIVKRQFPT